MAGRLASLIRLGQNERMSVIKLFLDQGENAMNKLEARELYEVANAKSLCKDMTVFQSYLTYNSSRGYVAEVKEGLNTLAKRQSLIVTPSWNAFLIEAHTRCGEFVAAQELLRKLSIVDRENIASNEHNAKVVDGLYIDLITEMAKSGRVRAAIALFDRMKERGFLPSAKAYNLAIDLRIENQDGRFASQLLADMRKQKFVPNLQTIARLITLKIAQGRPTECITMLHECHSHGPAPDLTIYAALIYGFHRTHQNLQVMNIFEEIYANMRAPREFFHCAIEAAGRLRNETKTTIFWNRMVKEIGVENLTEQDYATYMSSIANCGNLDEALRVLDEMHAAQLPRTHHTAFALMSIIAAQKNLEMARTHFESMRKSGYLAQGTVPWNSMMKLLLNDNPPDKRGVQKLFDEMCANGPQPDVTTYDYILNIVDESEMMKLYEEMKQKNVAPDQHVYHTMARRLGSLKKVNEIAKILDDMRDQGIVIPKIISALMKPTDNT